MFLTSTQGMRRLELEYCQQTFEVQFNFAIFYAFTKFQENELSNLLWLCECIAQQQKANLDEGMVHVGPWKWVTLSSTSEIYLTLFIKLRKKHYAQKVKDVLTDDTDHSMS